MFVYSIEERIIKLNKPVERKKVKIFLKNQGLKYDEDIEFTTAVYNEEKIIATGSFAGKVLKCIAVDPEYKGQGLSNRIVSILINEEYERRRTHLFIYTKPSNYGMFSQMGFYKLAEVPDKVVLLENNPDGIKGFIKNIIFHKKSGEVVSSIVMNCNPFTLGHQYLIEKAASVSDIVHVFIVWEDKSVFPAEVRYKLIEQGTKHLSNVVIHKGSDYVISSATFPSYFIKEYSEVVETHALLDLKIFTEYIASVLDINKRFIGEEPYCPVTGMYNRTMKKVLPQCGVEVIEIPRLQAFNNPISASKVREYLRNDDFIKIKEIVPKTTYDFLISKEAVPIINKLKKCITRH